MTEGQLKRLPSDCTAHDIVEASEQAGVVIVDGWLNSELVQRFNDEVEPWLQDHSGTNSGAEASDQFLGLNTKRLQALAVKTPSFVDILLDERNLQFAEQVLAPISPSIILNNGELIEIGPGEDAQPMHRDDDAWNFANANNPLMVNTIVALADITPEMGSTLLVPGSHLWDRDRVPSTDEIVTAHLPAGSAIFFRGDTMHAGGANTSNKKRRALSLGLCAGWLRPVENSFTNLPLEHVRTLPKRAQELFGYALYDASDVGGGYLGYHDMSDPAGLVT